MIKDVKPRPNRHNSTLEGSSETNIQGKTKKKSLIINTDKNAKVPL